MKVEFFHGITNNWSKDVIYKRTKTSIIFLFVGTLLTFYIEPNIVKIILKFLFAAKPGHYIRKRHEGKLEFTYKLYLWNVTNPNEITAGTEKPKLQEVGPYVFHEFKQKRNTTDNKFDDTVSFNVWSTYRFSHELSDPLTGNEVLTMLNMVIASGMVKIHLESPHFLNVLTEAMDRIFKKPSSIFVTMKAIEFIDSGIAIDCNHTDFSSKRVCTELRKNNAIKVMNDEKTLLRFRWFDKLNDSMQARYTVMRGGKNVRDVGRVTAINDGPLNVYKQDEKCNVINGTDFMYFPPLKRKEQILWGYSDAACKSFPLRYKYRKTVLGVRTAYKYMNLSDPLMNPVCECNRFSGCAATGTLDLYQCLGLFASISAPHFYLAESSIKDTIEGMEPKENLHETGCHIDLQYGVPIIAHQRVQVNLLVKPIPEYRIFSSINGSIWLPLLWFEEGFHVEKSDLAKIIISKILQVVLVLGGYTMVGVIGCAMSTAFIVHHNVKEHASIEPLQESSNARPEETN